MLLRAGRLSATWRTAPFAPAPASVSTVTNVRLVQMPDPASTGQKLSRYPRHRATADAFAPDCSDSVTVRCLSSLLIPIGDAALQAHVFSFGR